MDDFALFFYYFQFHFWFIQRFYRRDDSISIFPATANSSTRRDVANQTCRQIWKAAIGVGPWRVANDAAIVTQDVTAITLASNKNPDFQKENCETKSRTWPKLKGEVEGMESNKLNQSSVLFNCGYSQIQIWSSRNGQGNKYEGLLEQSWTGYGSSVLVFLLIHLA